MAGLERQQATRVAELAPILDRYGGTAGLLVEEAGPLACWPGVDHMIVSTDNTMTLRWLAGGLPWPRSKRSSVRKMLVESQSTGAGPKP